MIPTNPLNLIRKRRSTVLFRAAFADVAKSISAVHYIWSPENYGIRFTFMAKQQYLHLRQELARTVTVLAHAIRHEGQRQKSGWTVSVAKSFSQASQADLSTQAYIAGLFITAAKQEAQRQWLAAHPQASGLTRPKAYRHQTPARRPRYGYDAQSGLHRPCTENERVVRTIRPVMPSPIQPTPFTQAAAAPVATAVEA